MELRFSHSKSLVFALLAACVVMLVVPGFAQSPKGGPRAGADVTTLAAPSVKDAVGREYWQVRSDISDPEKLIYGSDDRIDVYETKDPGLLHLAQAGVVLVQTAQLTDNLNGTYALATIAFSDVNCDADAALETLCATEPYKGQRRAGFCSGFLVGPDLVVTAGHCIDPPATPGTVPTCSNIAFIFDYKQIDATTDPQNPVDADNVYFCSSIVNGVMAGGQDHAVIKLDRPVVNRKPLAIRRAGEPAADTPLIVVGHPQGLPMKIVEGGNSTVRKVNAGTEFFDANLDTYGANSGSMVVNAQNLVVEGVLVRGNTDFRLLPAPDNCCASYVCADTGCTTPPHDTDFEEVSKTSYFAMHIPEIPPVPAVSDWGMAGLLLLVLIGGTLLLRQRTRESLPA